ncbi:hypothetical protein JFK97_06105 [Chromobacterium phragmitis]|uniref:hypothetical protein n=1 Tax=Chromobacterium amazonense TaxID=1382803 RepID=UPI0021B7331B|nr:hypothetical protein [Chromobacterium amazonense]MBM2883959.1 hypothetical protein [Chromobacterium amazonense]MDE1711876.1 hypothetical protein [Chromobacterium amazonense]
MSRSDSNDATAALLGIGVVAIAVYLFFKHIGDMFNISAGDAARLIGLVALGLGVTLFLLFKADWELKKSCFLLPATVWSSWLLIAKCQITARDGNEFHFSPDELTTHWFLDKPALAVGFLVAALITWLLWRD